MARILEFIQHRNAFDPETIVLLSAAYEKALRNLHDEGQPQIVREVIAKRIIELASKGERDPERLCQAALSAISIRDA
jgi:hypothetical protein